MAPFFRVAVLGLLLAGSTYAQAPGPSRDPQTKELLDLMVDSLGGPEKLNSIHSFRRKWQMTVGSDRYQFDYLITTDSIRAEYSTSSHYSETRIGSPTTDFTIGGYGGKKSVYEGFAHPLLEAYGYAEPILVLQHVKDPAYTFLVTGSEPLGGTAATVLEVTHGVHQVTFWVDPRTGRVLRRRVLNSAYDLSDWRSVDGLVVPFEEKNEESGFLGVVSAIEFNPAIDPSVFERSGPTLASFPMNAPTPLPAPSVTKRSAPPKPHDADVTVATNPGGASVYVDDEPKGVTSPEGRLVLKGLPLGTHQIRVALVGHKQQVISREFKGGSEEIAVRLEKEGPRPLALEEVENALAGLPRKKVLELVKEFGVDFDITPERESRLRAAGADDSVLYAITQNKK
jgi:hypothetical protein